MVGRRSSGLPDRSRMSSAQLAELKRQWGEAGRQAYVEAIRSGEDVLARTEPEIEALGRERMERDPFAREEAPATREGNAVARAQRNNQASHEPDAPTAKDVLGKVWNAPNTLIGLAYGGAGHLLGAAMGRRPYATVADNAVQFRNNPLGGVGAITLGNTTTYNGDPDDPDPAERALWADVPRHERQHTIQGQQLGPAYLPSNILGGLWGVIRDGEWHGRSNWNERGPQETPARPWPRRH